LVHLTTRTRDRVMLLLLLKTGIRRHELVMLDVNSLDLDSQNLTLKETHKRSNRTVFLDDETVKALRRWLNIRETWPKTDGEKALFLNSRGLRLSDTSIDNIARKAVERVNKVGSVGQINFSPHIARYCMTTWLLDAEMPVRYIKWLRGDAIREAYEIYDTVRPEEVKKSYLENVPQFGV
jgi:integrase/recombinase XerD